MLRWNNISIRTYVKVFERKIYKQILKFRKLLINTIEITKNISIDIKLPINV